MKGRISLNLSSWSRRAISFSTVFLFLLSEIGGAYALPAPASVQALAVSTEQFLLPSEFGSVESLYRSPDKSKPFIVIIQDAHAVTNAQYQIANILEYLSSQYGVSVVAVEGGKGRMDATLLKAFPEKQPKTDLIRSYLESGELTGTEWAMIFGAGNMNYYGVEDWKLYQSNYFSYLRAFREKPKVLEILSREKEKLDEERKLVYSAAHDEFHLQYELFHEDYSKLFDFLQYLANRFPRLIQDQDSYKEKWPLVGALLVSIKEDGGMNAEALRPAIREMAEEFRKNNLERLPLESQKSFNSAYQSFLSAQMMPGHFLQRLLTFGREAGIAAKLTPALAQAAEHAHLLTTLKGSRLFDELHLLLEELEKELIFSYEEQRIADKYQSIRLLHSLASLELSHRLYQQFLSGKDQYFRQAGISPQLFEEAVRFYEIAVERDRAFRVNIQGLLRKEKVKSAAFVAGGFHTQGMEQLFRQEGYSYAVVMPTIENLQGHQNYESLMLGNYSYRDQLTTTFYEAFTKVSIRQLAEQSDGRVLKSWRDSILRELADQGRIQEAGQYTHFIDTEASEKFPANSFSKADATDQIRQIFSQAYRRQTAQYETTLNEWTHQLREKWPDAGWTGAALQTIAQSLARTEAQNVIHLARLAFLPGMSAEDESSFVRFIQNGGALNPEGLPLAQEAVMAAALESLAAESIVPQLTFDLDTVLNARSSLLSAESFIQSVEGRGLQEGDVAAVKEQIREWIGSHAGIRPEQIPQMARQILNPAALPVEAVQANNALDVNQRLQKLEQEVKALSGEAAAFAPQQPDSIEAIIRSENRNEEEKIWANLQAYLSGDESALPNLHDQRLHVGDRPVLEFFQSLGLEALFAPAYYRFQGDPRFETEADLWQQFRREIQTNRPAGSQSVMAARLVEREIDGKSYTAIVVYHLDNGPGFEVSLRDAVETRYTSSGVAYRGKGLPFLESASSSTSENVAGGGFEIGTAEERYYYSAQPDPDILTPIVKQGTQMKVFRIYPTERLKKIRSESRDSDESGDGYFSYYDDYILADTVIPSLIHGYQNGQLAQTIDTLKRLHPELSQLQLPLIEANALRSVLDTIAQDKAKEIISQVPFQTLTREGSKMDAFHSIVLPGIIVKVPKSYIDFKKEIQPGYQIAKDELGDLFANLLITDVTISLDGESTFFPYAIVQEKVTVIGDILDQYDEAIKASSTSAEQKRLIQARSMLEDKLIDLLEEIMKRGVLDSDFINLERNYGVTAAGRMVGFDADKVTHHDSWLPFRHEVPEEPSLSELDRKLREVLVRERFYELSLAHPNQLQAPRRVPDVFEFEVSESQKNYLTKFFGLENDQERGRSESRENRDFWQRQWGDYSFYYRGGMDVLLQRLQAQGEVRFDRVLDLGAGRDPMAVDYAEQIVALDLGVPQKVLPDEHVLYLQGNAERLYELSEEGIDALRDLTADASLQENSTAWLSHFPTVVISNLLNYINGRRLLTHLFDGLPEGAHVIIQNDLQQGEPAYFSTDRFTTHAEMIGAARQSGFNVVQAYGYPHLTPDISMEDLTLQDLDEQTAAQYEQVLYLVLQKPQAPAESVARQRSESRTMTDDVLEKFRDRAADYLREFPLDRMQKQINKNLTSALPRASRRSLGLFFGQGEEGIAFEQRLADWIQSRPVRRMNWQPADDEDFYEESLVVLTENGLEIHPTMMQLLNRAARSEFQNEELEDAIQLMFNALVVRAVFREEILRYADEHFSLTQMDAAILSDEIVELFGYYLGEQFGLNRLNLKLPSEYAPLRKIYETAFGFFKPAESKKRTLLSQGALVGLIAALSALSLLGIAALKEKQVSLDHSVGSVPQQTQAAVPLEIPTPVQPAVPVEPSPVRVDVPAVRAPPTEQVPPPAPVLEASEEVVRQAEEIREAVREIQEGKRPLRVVQKKQHTLQELAQLANKQEIIRLALVWEAQDRAWTQQRRQEIRRSGAEESASKIILEERLRSASESVTQIIQNVYGENLSQAEQTALHDLILYSTFLESKYIEKIQKVGKQRTPRAIGIGMTQNEVATIADAFKNYLQYQSKEPQNEIARLRAAEASFLAKKFGLPGRMDIAALTKAHPGQIGLIAAHFAVQDDETDFFLAALKMSRVRIGSKLNLATYVRSRQGLELFYQKYYRTRPTDAARLTEAYEAVAPFLKSSGVARSESREIQEILNAGLMDLSYEDAGRILGGEILGIMNRYHQNYSAYLKKPVQDLVQEKIEVIAQLWPMKDRVYVWVSSRLEEAEILDSQTGETSREVFRIAHQMLRDKALEQRSELSQIPGMSLLLDFKPSGELHYIFAAPETKKGTFSRQKRYEMGTAYADGLEVLRRGLLEYRAQAGIGQNMTDVAVIPFNNLKTSLSFDLPSRWRAFGAKGIVNWLPKSVSLETAAKMSSRFSARSESRGEDDADDISRRFFVQAAIAIPALGTAVIVEAQPAKPALAKKVYKPVGNRYWTVKEFRQTFEDTLKGMALLRVDQPDHPLYGMPFNQRRVTEPQALQFLKSSDLGFALEANLIEWLSLEAGILEKNVRQRAIRQQLALRRIRNILTQINNLIDRYGLPVNGERTFAVPEYMVYRNGKVEPQLRGIPGRDGVSGILYSSYDSALTAVRVLRLAEIFGDKKIAGLENREISELTAKLAEKMDFSPFVASSKKVNRIHMLAYLEEGQGQELKLVPDLVIDNKHTEVKEFLPLLVTDKFGKNSTALWEDMYFRWAPFKGKEKSFLIAEGDKNRSAWPVFSFYPYYDLGRLAPQTEGRAGLQYIRASEEVMRENRMQAYGFAPGTGKTFKEYETSGLLEPSLLIPAGAALAAMSGDRGAIQNFQTIIRQAQQTGKGAYVPNVGLTEALNPTTLEPLSTNDQNEIVPNISMLNQMIILQFLFPQGRDIEATFSWHGGVVDILRQTDQQYRLHTSSPDISLWPAAEAVPQIFTQLDHAQPENKKYAPLLKKETAEEKISAVQFQVVVDAQNQYAGAVIPLHQLDASLYTLLRLKFENPDKLPSKMRMVLQNEKGAALEAPVMIDRQRVVEAKGIFESDILLNLRETVHSVKIESHIELSGAEQGEVHLSAISAGQLAVAARSESREEIEAIITHPGWIKLQQHMRHSFRHARVMQLTGDIALFESYSRSEKGTTFLEYLDEVARMNAKELMIERYRLDGFMSSNDAQGFPRSNLHQISKESYFFRHGVQYARFYAKFLELLRTKADKKDFSPVNIEIVGPALFQEPLSLLVLIRTAYERAGVTLWQIPLAMNIVDRDSSANDLFRNQSLIYQKSFAEFDFDGFREILNMTEPDPTLPGVFDHHFESLLPSFAGQNTATELVQPAWNDSLWKPWLDSIRLHDDGYASMESDEKQNFIFINNVFFYVHGEEADTGIVQKIKSRLASDGQVYAADIAAQQTLTRRGFMKIHPIAGIYRFDDLSKSRGEPTVAQAQGLRPDMEDRYIRLHISLPGIPNGSGWILAVMDGHFNSRAAELVEKKWPVYFEQAMTRADGNIPLALAQAYETLINDIQIKYEISGSTFSVVYAPDHSDQVFGFNVGDSPILIYEEEPGARELKIVYESPEHNVRTNEAEYQRLKAMNPPEDEDTGFTLLGIDPFLDEVGFEMSSEGTPLYFYDLGYDAEAMRARLSALGDTPLEIAQKLFADMGNVPDSVYESVMEEYYRNLEFSPSLQITRVVANYRLSRLIDPRPEFFEFSFEEAKGNWYLALVTDGVTDPAHAEDSAAREERRSAIGRAAQQGGADAVLDITDMDLSADNLTALVMRVSPLVRSESREDPEQPLTAAEAFLREFHSNADKLLAFLEIESPDKIQRYWQEAAIRSRPRLSGKSDMDWITVHNITLSDQPDEMITFYERFFEASQFNVVDYAQAQSLMRYQAFVWSEREQISIDPRTIPRNLAVIREGVPARFWFYPAHYERYGLMPQRSESRERDIQGYDIYPQYRLFMDELRDYVRESEFERIESELEDILEFQPPFSFNNPKVLLNLFEILYSPNVDDRLSTAVRSMRYVYGLGGDDLSTRRFEGINDLGIYFADVVNRLGAETEMGLPYYVLQALTIKTKTDTGGSNPDAVVYDQAENQTLLAEFKSITSQKPRLRNQLDQYERQVRKYLKTIFSATTDVYPQHLFLPPPEGLLLVLGEKLIEGKERWSVEAEIQNWYERIVLDVRAELGELKLQAKWRTRPDGHFLWPLLRVEFADQPDLLHPTPENQNRQAIDATDWPQVKAILERFRDSDSFIYSGIRRDEIYAYFLAHDAEMAEKISSRQITEEEIYNAYMTLGDTAEERWDKIRSESRDWESIVPPAFAEIGFEVYERIGYGNQAVVFRALDPQQREVALKIIYDPIATDYPYASEREIRRVMERLGEGQRNLEKILDSGVITMEESEYPYVVTEYVSGGINLSEYVDNQQQPLSRSQFGDWMKITDQIMEGYDFLSAREVPRTDANTNNIMIIPDSLTAVHIDFLSPQFSQYTEQLMAHTLIELFTGVRPLQLTNAQRSRFRESAENIRTDVMDARWANAEVSQGIAEILHQYVNLAEGYRRPADLYARLKELEDRINGGTARSESRGHWEEWARQVKTGKLDMRFARTTLRNELQKRLGTGIIEDVFTGGSAFYLADEDGRVLLSRIDDFDWTFLTPAVDSKTQHEIERAADEIRAEAEEFQIAIGKWDYNFIQQESDYAQDVWTDSLELHLDTPGKGYFLEWAARNPGDSQEQYNLRYVKKFVELELLIRGRTELYKTMREIAEEGDPGRILTAIKRIRAELLPVLMDELFEKSEEIDSFLPALEERLFSGSNRSESRVIEVKPSTFGLTQLELLAGVYPNEAEDYDGVFMANLQFNLEYADHIAQKMREDAREGPGSIRVLEIGPGSGTAAVASLHQIINEERLKHFQYDMAEIDFKAIRNTQYNIKSLLKTMKIPYRVKRSPGLHEITITGGRFEGSLIRTFQVNPETEFDALAERMMGDAHYDVIHFDSPVHMEDEDFDFFESDTSTLIPESVYRKIVTEASSFLKPSGKFYIAGFRSEKDELQTLLDFAYYRLQEPPVTEEELAAEDPLRIVFDIIRLTDSVFERSESRNDAALKEVLNSSYDLNRLFQVLGEERTNRFIALLGLPSEAAKQALAIWHDEALEFLRQNDVETQNILKSAAWETLGENIAGMKQIVPIREALSAFAKHSDLPALNDLLMEEVAEKILSLMIASGLGHELENVLDVVDRLTLDGYQSFSDGMRRFQTQWQADFDEVLEGPDRFMFEMSPEAVINEEVGAELARQVSRYSEVYLLADQTKVREIKDQVQKMKDLNDSWWINAEVFAGKDQKNEKILRQREAIEKRGESLQIFLDEMPDAVLQTAIGYEGIVTSISQIPQRELRSAVAEFAVGILKFMKAVKIRGLSHEQAQVLLKQYLAQAHLDGFAQGLEWEKGATPRVRLAAFVMALFENQRAVAIAA